MVIKQFFIILSALFMGYVLSTALNLPIPSNVLGFLILFISLCIGVIKVKHVDKVSDFIIKYLSLFFVVPTVGIMVHFELISSQFVKILVPLMVSIILGYFVAAKVTEVCINFGQRKKIDTEKNGLGGGEHE